MRFVKTWDPHPFVENVLKELVSGDRRLQCGHDETTMFQASMELLLRAKFFLAIFLEHSLPVSQFKNTNELIDLTTSFDNLIALDV